MDTGKSVVIAGAGPAGTLCAIFLADQGFKVQVFERAGKPEKRPTSEDTRAFMLNLNSRAMRAFKEAKVDLSPLVPPCNGRVDLEFLDGKGRVTQSMSMAVSANNLPILRVFRDEIGRHLLDEACRLHPDAITFHFESPITGMDLEKRVATITQAKSTIEVEYDLLVGADGAGSLVRAALQKALPSGFMTRRRHDAVYACGPCRKSQPAEFPNHTFLQMHKFSEGVAMVYGRGDGDLRVGLFIDKSAAERIRKGDKMWMLTHLESSMPKLTPTARSSLKDLVDKAPEFPPISGWTILSQLHGPQVLLIGDSAHTMTPILGQGLNTGLEDSRIFASVLRDTLASGGGIDAALQRYTHERLPDIHALLTINQLVAQERTALLEGASQLGHALYMGLLGVAMRLHMVTHSVLNKAFPSVCKPPMLRRAIIGEAPFRSVLPAMHLDLGAALCMGGGLIAAGWFLARR